MVEVMLFCVDRETAFCGSEHRLTNSFLFIYWKHVGGTQSQAFNYQSINQYSLLSIPLSHNPYTTLHIVSHPFPHTLARYSKTVYIRTTTTTEKTHQQKNPNQNIHIVYLQVWIKEFMTNDEANKTHETIYERELSTDIYNRSFIFFNGFNK